MMFSGDEEFDDDVTSGIFPEDPIEPPEYQDSLGCLRCEAPGYTGLCDDCRREEEIEARDALETGADRCPPRE